MTKLADTYTPDLFNHNDEVLIIKPGDIFHGYLAKIDRKMNIVSFDDLKERETKHWKVKLDTSVKPINQIRDILPVGRGVSNIQYRDFHEDFLIRWSRLGILLYC